MKHKFILTLTEYDKTFWKQNCKYKPFLLSVLERKLNVHQIDIQGTGVTLYNFKGKKIGFLSGEFIVDKELLIVFNTNDEKQVHYPTPSKLHMVFEGSQKLFQNLFAEISEYANTPSGTLTQAYRNGEISFSELITKMSQLFKPQGVDITTLPTAPQMPHTGPVEPEGSPDTTQDENGGKLESE